MTQQPLSRRRALGTVAATSLAALFTAGAPRAAAATSRPAPLAGGTYIIAKNPGQLLTAQGVDEPLVILPPGAAPGAQEWEVVRLTHGNIALRNIRQNTYVGHQGTFRPHRFAVTTSTPYEWGLSPALHTGRGFLAFHLQAPDSELVLDRSPLAVYPPRVDLQLPRKGDVRQAWQFRAVTK
ncbi:hypothetical protein [Streptomyces sp. NPDC000851]